MGGLSTRYTLQIKGPGGTKLFQGAPVAPDRRSLLQWL